MARDMTRGNPGKTLFFFAVPMILGNIFQQFYNIVDSVVVGNFVGPDALAAVGSSGSITFLFIAIATGMSIGASVFISQLFGAKQYGRMKTAISTILIAMFGLSSVLMVIGLVLNKIILKFMNTPANILADAQTYLQIYFLGIIFLFLYNTLTAIYNALGESKIPLYFLILSSVINVILDLVFVIHFHMGVAGVAWATLIAQGISAILSFVNLINRIKKMNITEEFTYFVGRDLVGMGRIAIPSTIQQSILSVGMLLVQALVNGYGSVVIAGYTAATKIDSIAISPMVNVGNAASHFTAQNIGAGKPERVRKGYRAGLIMVAVIGLTIAVLQFLFGEVFLGFFVDAKENPEVIRVGIEYLRVVSSFYFMMGIMNVSNGVLRGAADMKIFMICTLCNLSVRVILAYTASTFIGESAIWWALPAGWFVGFCVAYIRLKSGKWQGKSGVAN
jgi:putative MATE family efflux protein